MHVHFGVDYSERPLLWLMVVIGSAGMQSLPQLWSGAAQNVRSAWDLWTGMAQRA